jgi:hypothetical protein
MRAKYNIRARRNLVQIFHENHAALLERAYHVLIMHNRVAHIQGCAKCLQSEFNHLDSVCNACAESARRRQQYFFHRSKVYLIQARRGQNGGKRAKNGV